MKEAYWGYWLVLLGIFVVVVMLLASDATTTNTQDYYQLKEVANSALYDSVDYSYYSQTRQIRILKEVFVENFLRRFAETVQLTDSYNVSFTDLYESPPKVSVKIATETAGFIVGRDTAETEGTENGVTKLDVVNSIDLIVEFFTNNRECNGLTCKEDEIINQYCSYYEENSGSSSSGGSSRPSTSGGGGATTGGSTTPSTGGSTTTPTAAPDLRQYIIDHAKDYGIYACTGRNCEKTQIDHIKSFACRNYVEDYSSVTEAACKTEVDRIYSSLPEKVNK